jgi:hypothetical protein
LEKTGVLDALTKVLVGLYEEPDRPNNAVEYIRCYLGASASAGGVDTEGLQRENQELRARLEKIQKLQAAQLQQQQQQSQQQQQPSMKHQQQYHHHPKHQHAQQHSQQNNPPHHQQQNPKQQQQTQSQTLLQQGKM